MAKHYPAKVASARASEFDPLSLRHLIERNYYAKKNRGTSMGEA